MVKVVINSPKYKFMKCSLIFQRAFFLSCFFISFLNVKSYGQDLELQRIKKQFSYNPSLDFRLDTRNSFITNRLAQINSVKVGLDFNKNVQVGIGLNVLTSDLFRRIDINDSKLSRLQFWYISPYFEYNFYHTDKVDISIPINVGLGRIGYSKENRIFTKIQTKARAAFVYEAYLIGNYKLIPIFGVGAGIGYRISVFNNGGIGQQLSSPIYVFKTQFYLSEIKSRLKKIE